MRDRPRIRLTCSKALGSAVRSNSVAAAITEVDTVKVGTTTSTASLGIDRTRVTVRITNSAWEATT